MTYSDTSPILSPSLATYDQARAYLTYRHRQEMTRLGLYDTETGEYKSRKAKEDGKTINADYTPKDIETIVGFYAPLCERVGIPLELPIAQLIKEAASLTSFWSQRPQRNSSGIGVDGTAMAGTPDYNPMAGTAAEHLWKYNTQPDRMCWEIGLSFPNWQVSAHQHIGRLLSWALRMGQGTPLQKELIAEADRMRSFPGKCRGTGVNLKRLGKVHNPTGIGWAAPGSTYGSGIAEIMNAIVAYQEG